MNQRRPRGRNNNNNNNRGRHQNPRNQSFDSNGPEGRVRGSATQVLERYLAQARDAQAAGDTVLAENLFQHAEHYYRVLSAANAQFEQQQQQQRERQGGQDDRERRGPRNEGDGEDGPDGRSEARSENRSDSRGEGQAAAERQRDDADEAPPPRQRRRRAEPRGEARSENPAAGGEPDRPSDEDGKSARSDSAKSDSGESGSGDAASGDDGIDAAFLKEPPKPRRRRRPVAETEAAD